MKAMVDAAGTNGSADGTMLANQASFGVYAAVNQVPFATANAQLSSITSVAATLTAAQAAVAGSIGGTSGSTFTLTSGVDAFSGTSGNDTFNANTTLVLDSSAVQIVVDTINGLDELKGGEGTDTLNIVTAVAATNAAPILTSIENVNVQFKAASIVDLTNATGTTKVSIHNSTATANVQGVGAASVSVANQTTAVTFGGSTAAALALNLDTVGTAATDMTLGLGTTVANKATSFAITANNAHVTMAEVVAGVATTSATIAATGTNELTFAAADVATIATLTVSGAGSVALGTAMTGLKTLTVADGGITLDATGGILANATTGAGVDTLTVVGATVVAINTGAGNDKVTDVTTALAATSVVNLGAGNDTYVMATAATAGATITAGEGTDTLSLAKATYATISAYTTAQKALLSGFETLSISDILTAVGGPYVVSTLTGVTNFVAAAGVTNAETSSVTGLGANSTVELKGAMTATGVLSAALTDATDTTDSITIIANNTYTENNDSTIDSAAQTQSFTTSLIETVNIVSTGTASTAFLGATGNKADVAVNTVTLTDVDVKTINISGDQAIVYTSAAGSNVLAAAL